MPTDGAGDQLRLLLQALLRVLELGHWRLIRCALRRPPENQPIAGSPESVRLAAAMADVAEAMRWQVLGEVHLAWRELERAALQLPAEFHTRDVAADYAGVVLPPRPNEDAPGVQQLTWLVARLVWREQGELNELQKRFARPDMTAREELTWACVEHLRWIDFCPFSWYRPKLRPDLAEYDGTSVDRTRMFLCWRGTRLRQFAHPATGEVSQSVWRDVDAFRGLCAEAYDQLAETKLPAPWWGRGGTEDLPVRVGRFRAWEHAKRWRADLDQANDLVAGFGLPSA